MQPRNPYAAPTAAAVESAPEVPVEINQHIRNAWIAACISGALTLVVTLVSMSGPQVLGAGAWTMVDVALIFGLAYGIWRKSRVCAVLMLAYFLMSKIWMVVETGQFQGSFVALIFLYYYLRGAIATFKYHALIQGARA